MFRADINDSFYYIDVPRDTLPPNYTVLYFKRIKIDCKGLRLFLLLDPK